MKIVDSLPLTIILFSALSLTVCAAEVLAPPFQVETDLQTAAIFPVGAEIKFKASLTYPDSYTFQGSSIYAYLFNLPGNFAVITGKEVKKTYGPKWASVTIEPMVWLPAAQRLLKEHLRSFSTKGWPPGDYSLTLSCFLQGKNRDEKLPDKYIVARMLFSLE